MKRNIILLLIVLLAIFFTASFSFAVQTCAAQKSFMKSTAPGGAGSDGIITVTLTCVDNGTNDTFSTTLDTETTAYIKALYLVEVDAIAGSPTPLNAASITIINESGRDLLGAQGANLVPTSGENSMPPYNSFTSSPQYSVIKGALTVTCGAIGASKQAIIKLLLSR